MKETREKNAWYFHSSASNYMYRSKTMLVEHDECISRNIKFIDDRKCSIRRRGKIWINLNNEKREFISNVIMCFYEEQYFVNLE